MRVLAVLALLIAASPAQAVLCRAKSGAIKERRVCKRKERLLDLLGSAGPKGDVGPKGQSGPPGAGAPRLYLADATGRRLPGIVTSSARSTFGELALSLGSPSRTVLLVFSADGFPPLGFQFYFESPQCLGTAYIRPPSPWLTDLVYPVGSHLVYAGDPLDQHVFQSELIAESPAQCTPPSFYVTQLGACCSPFSGSFAAGPQTVLDLGSWTPPLHVELEP